MPNTKGERTQQLTVVVRIRPLFEHEEAKGATKIARRVDEKMVLLSDPSAGDSVDILRAKRAQERKYVFDWAFDQDSSQEEVYEKTTKALVDSVVEGFNGTVFAYGATGSGKTYTMVGEDENPGIMVRALKHLFKEVDDKHKIYEVSMSYLEIYNENIRDLLNPSPAGLELREDSKGNHHVAGLSEVQIASSEEVMTLLTRGNKRRTQESTGANRTSSRSHAVLLVQVKRRGQQMKTGRLYMVDLAGSERAAQTQNTGKRLLEGAHINKSLLALGNCINALAERNGRYVNFRDSKLTRILKEPLSGNCRTVMVSHVSPSHFHFEESRNTLAYADRAKNITTKLRSNVSDVSYHVAQYQTIIGELRQEIDALQRKIKMPDDSKDEKKLTEEEMKELKKKLIESFNVQMDVRRRLMEIDNTLLAQSIEFDKLAMLIGEWETEKAVSSLDNRDDRDRNPDMPEQVQRAWDDLQFHKNQHHRYLAMREEADSDYRRCKRQTMALTDSLSSKASSREQGELLLLLARVYQLEIDKLEMQSGQLTREHEVRCRDLMILRYDRQRHLCDEIITKQRRLIDSLATGEKSENARRELNELYHIYQQEIQELSNGRSSDLSGLYRPNSLRSGGSMLELHQLDSNKGSPSLRSHPLPPIAAHWENADPLFQRRKRDPSRRDSDDSQALPPLGTRTFSRFSDSSSNSSSSMHDRRSISTGSPSDYSSSTSGHQPQKLKRVEELEEPLKKRFGLLPSLRQRRGASSDSEILAYNRDRQLESHASNRFHPEASRHKMAEERRTRHWGTDHSGIPVIRPKH